MAKFDFDKPVASFSWYLQNGSADDKRGNRLHVGTGLPISNVKFEVDESVKDFIHVLPRGLFFYQNEFYDAVFGDKTDYPESLKDFLFTRTGAMESACASQEVSESRFHAGSIRESSAHETVLPVFA